MPVDRWKSLGVTDKQLWPKNGRKNSSGRAGARKRRAFSNPKWFGMRLRGTLAEHLNDYDADLGRRGRRPWWTRRTFAQGAHCAFDEVIAVGNCLSSVTADSFVGVAQSAGWSLRGHSESLLARDGFVAELDGTGRQNQNQPAQDTCPKRMSGANRSGCGGRSRMRNCASCWQGREPGASSISRLREQDCGKRN